MPVLIRGLLGCLYIFLSAFTSVGSTKLLESSSGPHGVEDAVMHPGCSAHVQRASRFEGGQRRTYRGLVERSAGSKQRPSVAEGTAHIHELENTADHPTEDLRVNEEGKQGYYSSSCAWPKLARRQNFKLKLALKNVQMSKTPVVGCF